MLLQFDTFCLPNKVGPQTLVENGILIIMSVNFCNCDNCEANPSLDGTITNVTPSFFWTHQTLGIILIFK